MDGHYSKCCIKTGKLKKLPNTQKQHIAGAHKLEDMYYDKDGNVQTHSSQHMLSMQKGKNELIIEFGCRTDLDSMDQKIAMKIDMGADRNAIYRTMFKMLFPTHNYSLLQSYSKTLTRVTSSLWASLRLSCTGRASNTGSTSKSWTPTLQQMC